MDDSIANTASEVVGRLSTKNFTPLYPHSSAVCHNLSVEPNFKEIEFIKEYLNTPCSFPCEASFLLPFSSPSIVGRKVLNKIDPGLSLVKEKEMWEKHKRQLLNKRQKNEGDAVERVLKKSSKLQSLSMNTLLLTQHLLEDPDKFFNANYNLYYTGGDMTSFSIESMTFLARPKSCPAGEFIALEQLPVQSSQLINITDSEFIVPTDGEEDSIFQLEATDRFILSRQKKRVCLFSVKKKRDILRAKREFVIDSEVPYYSISLFGEKLCTLSYERKFEIFDIAAEKSSMNGTLDLEEGDLQSDKWCYTYFVDNNQLFFIDRLSVGFVDLRAKKSNVNRIYFGPLTEHCDRGFCSSQGSRDRQYIVTSHHLLNYDPRAGFSQRWTHGILHSPAHIYVLANDSIDKIFIGSQKRDSVVYIENDVSQSITSSKCVPYALPSLSDTLQIAHLNKCCCRIPVHCRFLMCTTGLCSIQNDSGSELYRTTSAHDIFCQNLIKSTRKEQEFILDSDVVERLKKWEEQCESLASKDNKCYVTKILKTDHITEIMTNDLGKQEFVEPSTEVDISKAEWKISKKEILSFTDYLAPKLLKEWNIDDLAEWAEDSVEKQPGSELPSFDNEEFVEKVTKRIKSRQEDIKDDNFNKSNTSEQMEQDLTLPSTSSAEL